MKKPNNVLFILSSIAFYLFVVPQDLLGIAIGFGLVAIIDILKILKQSNRINITNKKKNIFLSALVSLLLFYIFNNRWLTSDRVISISNFFRVNTRLLVFLSSVILLVSSSYFIYKVICEINNVINSIENEKSSNFGDIFINPKIYCIICSIITITICSKSSFIYPLNDWVDSNIYFTIGKSILKGKVIYRDLLDQKGPVIYFIHSLASIISFDSFIGMYIIETIACFFYLFYINKIVEFYIPKKGLLLMPVVSILTYSIPAFCHGDSAEELCLPFIAYAMYIGLKCIKESRFLRRNESLLLGIIGGIVFWIKFTLVGIFVGMFIPLALLAIKERNIKEIFISILFILVGFIIISIPVIIYFLMNNALIDLYNVYFYDNLFLYTSDVGNSLVSKLIYGINKGYINIRTFNEINMILIIIGLIYSYYSFQKEEILLIISMLLFSFTFVYAGGKGLAYYSLILSPLNIWGLIFVYKIISKYIIIDSFDYLKISISLLLLIVLLATCTGNRYLMFEKKSNMPQYRFKETIDTVEDPTLLNYCFLDGGFYTTANIVPNKRVFCLINYPTSELIDVQGEYCNNGEIDFIVARDTELNFDLYELVDNCDYYYENKIHSYYLYELKTLLNDK